MLPADDFVERLRDPVQRQQLSRKLRKELWIAYGSFLVVFAAWIFLTLQNRFGINDFGFILAFLACGLLLSDIRHRRHLIELFEVLSKRESGD